MSELIKEIMKLGDSDTPSGLVLGLVEVASVLNLAKTHPGIMTEHEVAVALAKKNELAALLDLALTGEKFQGPDFRRDRYKDLEEARIKLKDLTDG